MNNPSQPQLQERTKSFALRVIRLTASLESKNTTSRIIAQQLLRSGTSVGAQYREAKRARSTKEMISKLQSAQQELDESQYWLELIVEAELVAKTQLEPLMEEAEELMCMLSASIITLKRKSHGD